MIRFTQLFALALGAAVLLAPTVTAEAQDKPVASIVEPVKDFQLVPKGKVLENTFEIRNDGQATLEITDVRPACGCTVVDYDRQVAPGAVGKIHSKVETDGFSGPIAKTIAVFTNDPDNPKLQLVVKAEVKPFISVSPGYARFSYVQGEPSGTIKQTIWAQDHSDLEVTEVKSPYDHIQIAYRPATEDERNAEGQGKQWVVDVTIAPDSPVGALRDYVEVYTDHPEQKRVRIAISGFVRPRQWVTPEKVEFGELDASVLPARRSLTFTNFATDEIEIKEVETGHEGLSAEVEAAPRQPGHRFQVHLTLSPEAAKGSLDGVVKIHTTDAKNPVVEVPLTGLVK